MRTEAHDKVAELLFSEVRQDMTVPALRSLVYAIVEQVRAADQRSCDSAEADDPSGRDAEMYGDGWHAGMKWLCERAGHPLIDSLAEDGNTIERTCACDWFGTPRSAAGPPAELGMLTCDTCCINFKNFPDPGVEPICPKCQGTNTVWMVNGSSPDAGQDLLTPFGECLAGEGHLSSSGSSSPGPSRRGSWRSRTSGNFR